MSRIRYLKPEFFEDEDLAEHTFWIRLLFAGLWNIADKAGRLEDRPKKIKAKIFPYDNVNIETGLTALAKRKNNSPRPFIIRYIIDDEKYIQIVKWENHQKPHHTEKESEIPPHPPKIMVNGEDKGNGEGECNESITELPNGSLTVKGKKSIKTTDKSSFLLFWEYFLLKTKKRFTLTPDRKALILKRLKTYSLEDLKKAVDNFIADDWPERQNRLDLIYCIGKQQAKPDNLERWINQEPKSDKGEKLRPGTDIPEKYFK